MNDTTTPQEYIKQLEAQLAEAQAALKQAEEACDKLSAINDDIATERDKALTAIGSVLNMLPDAMPRNQDTLTRHYQAERQIELMCLACQTIDRKNILFGFKTSQDSARADLDADIAASQAAGVKFNEWTPEQRAQAEAMQEEADA